MMRGKRRREKEEKKGVEWGDSKGEERRKSEEQRGEGRTVDGEGRT